MQACFSGHHSIEPTPENVIGVLSLIFWSLNFIVSFKYIGVVLRADNRGEGGSFALLAQVHPLSRPQGGRRLLISIGLIGAALLYGDGVITPAISVLSAIEGVTLAAPAVTPLVWPDRRGGADRPLRSAEARHGADRRVVRTGDGDLVHLDHTPRDPRHPHEARGLEGDQSVVRRGLLSPRRSGGVPHPRRGRAGRHRRRGLVRRHGTLRPAADPGDLVQRGASRAAHQLLRAGGAAPRGSLRPGQSVLSPGAGLGALPDGGYRHGRRRRGLPGAHLRRVLPHPPGGAAGVHPAGHGRPHLQHPDGPDLHPGGELGPVARLRRAGGRLPALEQPGGRLRGGGHRHDAHDHPPAAHHRVRPLGLAPLAGPRTHGGASARGPGLLQRQHHQGRGRRLVPDRGWPRRVPADDDLEPRPGPAPGDRTGEHAGHGPVPCRTSGVGSHPGSPAPPCS